MSIGGISSASNACSNTLLAAGVLGRLSYTAVCGGDKFGGFVSAVGVQVSGNGWGAK